MSEFGGHITLTNNWARAILQSMYWVKRNRTVIKIDLPPPPPPPPSPRLYQVLAEEIFTFQKSIATVVYDHDMPSDLISNLDQTLVSWEIHT